VDTELHIIIQGIFYASFLSNISVIAENLSVTVIFRITGTIIS